MPVRTCIGCRKKSDAADMLRIAKQVDEAVGLWKGTGRSAYMHRESACIEAGLSKGRLERALRRSISPAERARLREELDAS